MEYTEHGVVEALGLYLQEFIYRIGGYIFGINGLFERCKGIGALGAH